MNNSTKCLCFALIFLLNHSCNFIREREITREIQKQIEAIHLKGILLPDSLKILYNDNLYINSDSYYDQSMVKVISSISGDCFECVKRLEKWENEIIKHVDTNSVKFYFIINVTDPDLFINNIYPLISIDYPLVIDDHALFNTINNLDTMDEKLRTFLLDKDDNVILVGNPFLNPDLKNLYLKKIDEMSQI